MLYLAAGTLLQCAYYLTECHLCLLKKKEKKKKKGGKKDKKKREKKNIGGIKKV